MIFTGQLGTTDARLAAVELGAIPAVGGADSAAAGDGASVAAVRLLLASPANAWALAGSADTAPALTGSSGTAPALGGSNGTSLAAGGAGATAPSLNGGVGTSPAVGGSPGTAVAATASVGTTLALGASTAGPGLAATVGDRGITGSVNTQLSFGGSSGSMATIANISFYKGEDVTLTVTMSPATNITGWTLAFTVRKSYGDASALMTKTSGAGITVTDATNGVFKVAIASADSTGLEQRAYVFDIQRTDSGSRTVLTIGTLTLLPEVTL